MSAPAGLDWRREELPLPELSRPAGASCCPAVVPVGLVSLDWLDHPELPAEAAAAVPIVLVIPGLTGDSSASYVARFDPELYKATRAPKNKIIKGQFSWAASNPALSICTVRI